MNCSKCGQLLTQNDALCPNCGEPNAFYNANNATVNPVTPQNTEGVVTPEPVQVPVQEPVAVPEPVQVPVQEPVAVPEPVQAPVQEPVAVPEPVQAPVQEPVVVTEPVQAPVQEPVAVPEPVQAPVQEPVAVPEPVQAPVQEPVAVPEPVQAPVQDPVVVPEPVQAPVQQPTSTVEPEPISPNPQPIPIPVQQDIQPVQSTQSSTTTKPKKNGLFIFLIIIIILVVLGVGGYVGKKLYDDSRNKVTDEVEKVEEKNEDSKAEITVGGVKFLIENDVYPIIDSGAVYLHDLDSTYSIKLIGINNATEYATVKAQLPTLQDQFQAKVVEQGGTYISTSEFTEVGRIYSAVSYFYQTIYTDIVYTDLGEGLLLKAEVSYVANGKSTAYKVLKDTLSTMKMGKTFENSLATESLLDPNIAVVKEFKKSQ